MSHYEDAERFNKLLNSGWKDEEVRLMALTEDQLVMLGEDMIVMMQRAVGSSVGIVLSVEDHVTVLPDNTIIIEARGRVD